ncbi:unnamed protein product [Periconia digitata]|uniref:Uncharacterized protein n=1 Tax=Periconia digitata TaxID=1303443 RepID=A0A9W4UND3_9PLEO|nr:unnamed protein product [Periconia digitata]
MPAFEHRDGNERDLRGTGQMDNIDRLGSLARYRFHMQQQNAGRVYSILNNPPKSGCKRPGAPSLREHGISMAGYRLYPFMHLDGTRWNIGPRPNRASQYDYLFLNMLRGAHPRSLRVPSLNLYQIPHVYAARCHTCKSRKEN